MIELKFIDGRTSPFVVCDMCKQPIEDMRMGVIAYLYHDDVSDGDSVNFAYLHKKPCHDAFDRLYNKMHAWDEMYQHFIFLLHNAGLPAEKLAKYDSDNFYLRGY